MIKQNVVKQKEGVPSFQIRPLAQPLLLPNGTTLKNRLAKSALSEALAKPNGTVSKNLIRLYQRWASSGAGLLITGNVMVDRSALGEPGNVVIEDERDLKGLSSWAKVASLQGCAVWMQINHPGKQAPRGLNLETVAPSAIPFNKKLAPFFSTPRELTDIEIWNIIRRFGNAAVIAKKAGFSGVQLHGAHGYLISQFLSPHHNRREDDWGGTPVKRRRFVMEIYHELRHRLGPDFPIGIKLNSADFQRGGFTEEESIALITELAKEGIDLVEISGGNYEEPVMMQTGAVMTKAKESTIEREAFFLEFAEKVRKKVKVPLMVTGGFRSLSGMEAPLKEDALDVVGLGRILAIEPEAPSRLLLGEETHHRIRPLTTGIKYLDNLGSLELTWYTRQMHYLGKGLEPKPYENGLKSFLLDLHSKGIGAFRNRRLRA